MIWMSEKDMMKRMEKKSMNRLMGKQRAVKSCSPRSRGAQNRDVGDEWLVISRRLSDVHWSKVPLRLDALTLTGKLRWQGCDLCVDVFGGGCVIVKQTVAETEGPHSVKPPLHSCYKEKHVLHKLEGMIIISGSFRTVNVSMKWKYTNACYRYYCEQFIHAYV